MTDSQRRGGHKTQVRRIIGNINEELLKDEPSNEILLNYQGELLRQKKIIQNYDEAILRTIEDDQAIENEISTSSDFMILMDATNRRINRTTSNVNYSNRTESLAVKLPNIKLMKFTGDSLQWTKFWDLFKSSIHERKDLSGATKFHYLVSQLEGEAEQLLAGFDHTDNEYQEAVSLLTETYGKHQRLIQARLHALFDLENPKVNATDLSKFRSLYEGHLRGLKTLGADIDAAGYVFAELLIRKLPSKIRDNLNRSQKSDFWNLSDLRREIDVEIGHLQSVSIEDNSSDSIEIQPTAVFKTTNFVPKCYMCSGDHFTHSCSKYSSVSEKRNRVNELKLCFNCLKTNHVAKKCQNAGRCRNCNSKHHTTLCDNVKNTKYKIERPKFESTNLSVSNTPAATMSAINSTSTSVLPTAHLSIIENNRTNKFKAILDTGSQRTFILKSIVRSLCLPIIDSITLTIDGFNYNGKSKNYDLTKFNVVTSDGILEITAIVIDNLPSRINLSGRSELVKTLNSQGLILADPTLDENLSDLGILIGVDYFFKLLGASRLDDNIYGIQSKIGTIIGGTLVEKQVSCNQITVLKLDTHRECSLDDKLQKFWEMDNIDLDSIDSNVLSDFKKSISFDGEKYSVGLPWKFNHAKLPVNYYYAKSRLSSNLNKLRKTHNHIDSYNKVIVDQLEAGYIEDVTNIPANSERTHYLAHSGILRDSETTPLRIVFDCSARVNKKPSLNDCLYPGPNLINNLSDILLRFRLGKYAATSDIKKAFLNVRLNLNDRDSTRFLWPENPHDECSPLKIYRFKSVLFGSTASPFLLNATLKHHLESENNYISKEILDNVYIDNLYLTSDRETELLDNKLVCAETLKKAGFSLHEWYSNSSSVTDNSEKIECNILGMNWNTREDLTSVTPVSFDIPNNHTKRSIVSNVATAFDPMGILLPVTVRGRIIIQDLWKIKLDWDDIVPTEMITSLVDFYSDVEKVCKLKIPRLITSTNSV